MISFNKILKIKKNGKQYKGKYKVFFLIFYTYKLLKLLEKQIDL